MGLLGLASTVVTGYYSGISAVGDRDRAQTIALAKVEERVDNNYKAIVALLDEMRRLQEQNHADARADINGIHGEIMQILRAQHPQ